MLEKFSQEIVVSHSNTIQAALNGSLTGPIGSESSYVRDLLDKISHVRQGWETLTNKKDKLKKTAYMCSQELKKIRQKLKIALRSAQSLKTEKNKLEKENVNLHDRVILQEEKMEYYKKQEMEISLARSYKSTTSDDLNTKLIHQNQEILERFHQEEERCEELEEEAGRLREQKEKARKKILKLKMEVNKLLGERESKLGGTGQETEELREKLNSLREEKEALEEENEMISEDKERVQIACDTYERKLNELIDKHNDDVGIYEEEIGKLKGMIDQDRQTREKNDESLHKLFTSQIDQSDAEFNKLKESLIHNNRLETENQNLKAENAELKLDLLNIKQKQMSLMNKYSWLKSKFKKR